MSETFQVRLSPNGGSFSCVPGQTILEAALSAGYWLPHSCQQGTCGTCKLHCSSGSVAGVRDAESPVLGDELLTCCATPTSDLTLDAPGVSAEPGFRLMKAAATVTAVERVSHDVARVQLKVRGPSPFRFKAGQYAQVLMRDGSRRSYSMANACDESSTLEWHIRHMPGGRFSSHAYTKLRVGEMLRVEGPFGSFMLHEGESPIVLLASGTGYAPIASFLETHREELARRNAVLYWGGNREADLYDVSSVAEWEARYPGVKLIPVLSSASEGWSGRRGFVHKAVLEDVVDLSSYEVYACGNPLMIDAARADFQKAGLGSERFYCDAFIVQPISTPALAIAAG